MSTSIPLTSADALTAIIQAVALSLNVSVTSVVVGAASDLCGSNPDAAKRRRPVFRQLLERVTPQQFPMKPSYTRIQDPLLPQISLEDYNTTVKATVTVESATDLSFSIVQQISGMIGFDQLVHLFLILSLSF